MHCGGWIVAGPEWLVVAVSKEERLQMGEEGCLCRGFAQTCLSAPCTSQIMPLRFPYSCTHIGSVILFLQLLIRRNGPGKKRKPILHGVTCLYGAGGTRGNCGSAGEVTGLDRALGYWNARYPESPFRRCSTFGKFRSSFLCLSMVCWNLVSICSPRPFSYLTSSSSSSSSNSSQFISQSVNKNNNTNNNNMQALIARSNSSRSLLNTFKRNSFSVIVRANSHFTADKYPVNRGDYARLEDDDLTKFKTILSDNQVITDSNDLVGYNHDWMKKYIGQSQLVLKPKTVEQVAEIIKYCNQRKLAVVPQGGNTGLVGGSVPVFDEIVLSLASMNKVRSFDESSGILKVDAGVILENADNYLAEKGYIFPLDLGAKGSCFVGGNVATNAGGLRLLKYGSLHGTVLGLEVVLPDGTIFDSMHSLRKDNTGYDLKQLFIGSEGSLGVITGVSILCPARPKAVNIAFLGLESYEKVTECFQSAKAELGEILSAFEFMDNESQLLAAKNLKTTHPLCQEDLAGVESVPEYPFYVLIETSGSNKDHDDEKLEAFLEKAMETEVVADGTVSQDESQLKTLWTWRESIAEASQQFGGVYKYDVSLPLDSMYSLVESVQERLESLDLVSTEDASKPVYQAVGYGHIGDGNLHLNVAVREYNKEVEKALEPFVYEFIQKHHGSISAEHGLGFQKKNYISYSKSDAEIKMIKDLKNHYDPNGIMNPYKYI